MLSTLLFQGRTMTHIRTLALLMAAIVVMTNSAFAQNLQDVVYKRDGSVLRGILVEQDFENGRYKIQLEGGSVFSVDKADIEKITKEVHHNAAVNINIDNNPTINQNPVIKQDADISPMLNNTQKTHFDNVFYIGVMGKSIMTEDEQSGKHYSGLNLAYQKSLSKHFTIYSAVNVGRLIRITSFGSESDLPEGADAEKYRSLEVDALFSTNNYQGWQFYTGLGLFKEKYSLGEDCETVTGTNLILGMGYSWKSLQAQLRVAINNSSDYQDDINASSSALQLGFNF
jgi:hypothetical protein